MKKTSKTAAVLGMAAIMAAMSAVPVLASDKTWVVKTDTVFPPFEYTDENGELVGIDVDILAAVAEDQGFDYTIESIGWDSAIAACQSGQADAMIAGASITDERKESGWIFTDGYYEATQCMAVKDDSDITGFDGLEGKAVGVKTGTQSALYAESLMEEYGFEITYFEDSATMWQAVLGGQCAACFDDTPIMAYYIAENDMALKLLPETENEPAEYGLAVFNEDNQELIDMFNAGLKNIKENGKYDEILAKYLGGEDADAGEEADAAGEEAEDTETAGEEAEETDAAGEETEDTDAAEGEAAAE